MCQQHTRTYTCGHHEALKPRYCPLVVQNGGLACETMEIVDRATTDLCVSCQAELAARQQQVDVNGSSNFGGGVNGMGLQVPVLGMQDVAMSGT
jgi:hypothetical protein